VNVDDWVQGYARAWEDADDDAAVALFTQDASYSASVFEEPFVGGDAIRGYWKGVTSRQREVVVRTGRPIIAQDRVAVEWWTTMIDLDHGDVTLPGCLLLRFDGSGLCTDLWEYWHVEPGRRDPPSGWGE
jgi:hypothetical protein